MKKTKKQPIKRVLSIAFWMAIPATFAVGALCLITFLVLFDKLEIFPERWVLFVFGVMGSIAVLQGSKLARFRIFVHEVKHALAVFVSGAKLKGFAANDVEGEVSYEIPEDQAHYMPVIGLAPYCFPLFSLPVLAAALFFGEQSRDAYTLALGFAMGLDLSLSAGEIDPRQTDFGTVAGGFFASALYIGGTLFMWGSVCVLWVLGGRNAFLVAGYLALRMVRLFTERYVGVR